MSEKWLTRPTVLRWALDFIVSGYVAVLVVSGNDFHGTSYWSWSSRMYRFLYPDIGRLHLIDDPYGDGLASLYVVCIVTVAVFFVIRLLTVARITRYIALTLVGLLSIAAYPGISLLGVPSQMMFPLTLELAVALGFLICWQYREWPTSTGINITLLTLHVALWAAISRVPLVIDQWFFVVPRWSRRYWFGHSVVMIYPFLGWVLIFIWAMLVRRQKRSAQMQPASVLCPN